MCVVILDLVGEPTLSLFSVHHWHVKSGDVYFLFIKTMLVWTVSEDNYYSALHMHSCSLNFACVLSQVHNYRDMYLTAHYYACTQTLRDNHRHTHRHTCCHSWQFLGQRGKGRVSLMLGVLRTNCKKRSKPRPKPPWGLDPNCLSSRYLHRPSKCFSQNMAEGFSVLFCNAPWNILNRLSQTINQYLFTMHYIWPAMKS